MTNEKGWVCPICKASIWKDDPTEHALAIAEHFRKCGEETRAKILHIQDILPREVIEGNLITMDEVCDRLILLHSFTLKDSTFKEDTQYLSMEIELDGEQFILNTGAERIVQAFKQLPHEKLPVYVTFEKVQTTGGRRVYRIKV